MKRCQVFKSKPPQQQKQIKDKCRKGGGTWSPTYCICKKKSRVGIG